MPDGGRNRSLAHTVGQRLILPKTAEGAAGGGRSIEYNHDCAADADFVSGRSKVRHRPQQPRRCYIGKRHKTQGWNFDMIKIFGKPV